MKNMVISIALHYFFDNGRGEGGGDWVGQEALLSKKEWA